MEVYIGRKLSTERYKDVQLSRSVFNVSSDLDVKAAVSVESYALQQCGTAQNIRV